LTLSAATALQKKPAASKAVRVDVVADDDAALVDAARRGDQAAFARLFERHHGRVYAMCRRLLRDPAEVEDAVQQAFLEAWRSLYRFEGRSRFSTWITRIAIHTCLGFRRRIRRLFLLEDAAPGREEARAVWASPPATPDDGAAERDRKRALDDVLWRLSPKKRVVFVLADLEGMTAPEISRVLDIPDATVRTRLFHARKELAGLVRRHPGFADLFAPGDEP
jgi:RNA polymerase sigma-70 factor (ECF subfamily)